MKSLSVEEENIIKDIRNLFRLKQGTKLHCNLKMEEIFLD